MRLSFFCDYFPVGKQSWGQFWFQNGICLPSVHAGGSAEDPLQASGRVTGATVVHRGTNPQCKKQTTCFGSANFTGATHSFGSSSGAGGHVKGSAARRRCGADDLQSTERRSGGQRRQHESLLRSGAHFKVQIY